MATIQPLFVQSVQKETNIQLAKEAIKRDQIQSSRGAAKTFNANRETLRQRVAGRRARRDCTPNSRLLTDWEEQVLIQYILDLDTRGFGPNLLCVRDMASQISVTRGGRPAGIQWPRNFVNRQQALKTRFNRRLDYQRALNEDPKVIGEWFDLVRNFKAKHGIVDDDVFNFDETGFLMGMISTQLVVTGSERRNRPRATQPGDREWVTAIVGVNATGWAIPPYIIFAGKMHLSTWYEGNDIPSDWVITLSDHGWTTDLLGLDWLKHFDTHTKTRVKGTYRLLILDGHGSHMTLEFENYCKENKILTLCMPAHTSHLLQPLDVGCFGPLKKAYGLQIDQFMRNHINHITKTDFLPAFRAAFDTAITSRNIYGGFRGTGLIPFNPESVISKLDVRLVTPTPPPNIEYQWESKTPSNQIEMACQTDLIKGRIIQHQNSSPTPITDAVNQVLKGTVRMASELELLRAENKRLQEANAALSKRKARQKKEIQNRGSLTKAQGSQLIDQIDVDAQIEQEIGQGVLQRAGGTPAPRRCGRCRQPGHRIETCPVRLAEVEESNS
jgi:hypothetical protein